MEQAGSGARNAILAISSSLLDVIGEAQLGIGILFENKGVGCRFLIECIPKIDSRLISLDPGPRDWPGHGRRSFSSTTAGIAGTSP